MADEKICFAFSDIAFFSSAQVVFIHFLNTVILQATNLFIVWLPSPVMIQHFCLTCCSASNRGEVYSASKRFTGNRDNSSIDTVYLNSCGWSIDELC